ncbi:MAG: phosphoglucosamine mutase [Sedimenticola sp.]|uniref:Phosphoglucosamine mutase n=1 Tax=Sedimenticola thiotaurini TaxID=1543721 RepID=A0A558CUS5_9GAMM|nr:phosphoglucosamine mutase [Sedimenticola sp.]MCW8947181.1 phosphoglucosamine mutase [Sedimenticola sp.]MCW8948766.1 phosphoglucosamine mutase [Sedimenticola sp.]MCW8975829.1 phosphoglucosamine mutase [Sedimenticola sp.]TVT52527.1 MAG: phosphoglucosamine mutase [Sedimenticola thiotaurini]
MKRKYFGTDGIRGRVGEGKITPEFVMRLGWAAGRVLGNGKGSKVLIGKDTRISGYLFESALEAGLVAAGVDIHLLGPMPTPGIAYLTRTLHAQAGIVISASHNPHCDNGIKFFSSEGKKLPDEVELAIERELDKPMTTVASEYLGKAYRVSDAPGRYIEFCKSTIPWTMSFKGLKMVVDCAHGATYHIAPHVLQELGAEVIAIGAEPNGLNINAGVGSTHIGTIQKAVLEHKADLGIALDGDGDRLIMVDALGEVLDGDDILYIIACSRLRRGVLDGGVVGTKMTNFGLEHALNQHGIDLVRTDVGDRYILERLQIERWSLGGEPSGHIICLDRTTTGDGIISALQVLAEVVKSGRSLHELRDGYLKYPQVTLNVKLGSANAADLMKAQAVQDSVDSVATELADTGRVLLRPSGTEPLIRVTVEGRDAEQIMAMASRIANLLETMVSGESDNRQVASV